MTLLVIAFLSGVLTVLAPCVLPLLPIILGASAEDGNNKKIPLVIIGSLSVSILIFSILLKASTVLIGVPPSFWKAFSGGTDYRARDYNYFSKSLEKCLK